MPRILATQATMPPMPAGGFTPLPLDQYLKALVMSLNDDRMKVGDRVERRCLYGPTSDFPTARGAADLYYDTTIGELYMDTGTWKEVTASHTHSEYLPLTAETSAPLTGDLYIDGTTPAVFLREGGAGADLTSIQDAGTTATFRKLAATGGGVISLRPEITDGSGLARVDLFRTTSTTGARKFILYEGSAGDTTIQHEFDAGSGDVNLCQQAGSIQQAGVDVSLDGHTHSGITDADAIHLSEAEEFNEVASATPASADRILFEDATASYAKRYNTISSLPFADSVHSHDDLYYTETEIDTALALYLPLTAGSGKEISGELFLGSSSSIKIDDGASGTRAIARTSGTTVWLSDTDAATVLWGNPLTLNSNANIILDPASTYGVLLNDNNTALQGRIQGSATYYNLVRVTTADVATFGNSTLNALVNGAEVRLNGIITKAGVPTTSEFPSGTWGAARDTSANKTYLCANYGGTLYKWELT